MLGGYTYSTWEIAVYNQLGQRIGLRQCAREAITKNITTYAHNSARIEHRINTAFAVVTHD